jgi:hypothetical protein
VNADAKGVIFNFAPHSRDALTRGFLTPRSEGEYRGGDAVTFPHSQECRNVRKCKGVKVVLKFEA